VTQATVPYSYSSRKVGYILSHTGVVSYLYAYQGVPVPRPYHPCPPPGRNTWLWWRALSPGDGGLAAGLLCVADPGGRWQGGSGKVRCVQQTIITPSRQRFGSICCCRCCSGLRPRMTGSSRTQFDAFVFLSAAPAPVPGGVSQESSQDCRAGDKKFRQDSSLHRPLLRGIWCHPPPLLLLSRYGIANLNATYSLYLRMVSGGLFAPECLCCRVCADDLPTVTCLGTHRHSAGCLTDSYRDSRLLNDRDLAFRTVG
jgi:hypothetical protein